MIYRRWRIPYCALRRFHTVQSTDYIHGGAVIEYCCAIFRKEREGVATIKEAVIKIESRIENLDEAGIATDSPERTEQELTGFLFIEEGGYRLTYAEESEGGDISSELQVKEGLVRVVRRGAIESSFEFVKGVPHSSVYSMGQYSFDVKILPRRVDAEITREGGKVDLLYNMSIGGADKAVRMKIWIQTN